MSIDKTEAQEFAGRKMHQIGGFFMPEINRACDEAADEARNVRFVTVMVLSAIEGDKVIGNAVMFNDKINNDNVQQVLRLALANMRREDSTVTVKDIDKP